MVDNLKKIDMKLPILELAQLKTKAERRPFCEEYGPGHKQLKRGGILTGTTLYYQTIKF